MTSYSTLIETMLLSCTVFKYIYTNPETLVKTGSVVVEIFGNIGQFWPSAVFIFSPTLTQQETLLLQRDRARHLSVEILQLQNISLENPIELHYLGVLRLAVMIQYRNGTDTHTDRRTDTRRRHIPHLA